MNEASFAKAILKEQRHQKQRAKKLAAVSTLLAVGAGQHLTKQLAEKPIQPLGAENALNEMANGD